MSVKVMSWVWEHATAAGTDLLVLLAIADHAHDDGGSAWPSVATLAAKARCSPRTVQRSVRQLAERGALVVEPSAAQRGLNVYRIVMDPPTPVNLSPPADVTPPVNLSPPKPPMSGQDDAEGCQSVRGDNLSGVTTVSPEPSTSPGSCSSRSPTSNSGLSARTDAPTATRTGTRLPDGFTATPDMIAWAREHTPLVGAAETERFCDYWRAQPGAKGRKTDWVATWRNWMRKANDDATARQARASPNGRYATAPTPQPAAAADVLAALDAKVAAERRNGSLTLVKDAAEQIGGLPP